MAPRPGPISTSRSPGRGSIAAHDARDHARIVQEVLAEAFARNVHQARADASCSARSIASRARLPGSALPVPASVERGAVVDGRADDRQAERHVHGAARSRRT